jgi:DNA-directed RNA polymerase I subunit RPA1
LEIPSLEKLPNVDKPLKPVEAAATSAKIAELLSGEDGKTNAASLDSYMQSQLNPLASEIIKMCLPNGLEVPFPQNVSVNLINAIAMQLFFRYLTNVLLFSIHSRLSL